MGLTDSYAYFLPVHALYQIVSIKLCHKSNDIPYAQPDGLISLRPTSCLPLTLLDRNVRFPVPVLLDTLRPLLWGKTRRAL